MGGSVLQSLYPYFADLSRDSKGFEVRWSGVDLTATYCDPEPVTQPGCASVPTSVRWGQRVLVRPAEDKVWKAPTGDMNIAD